MKNIIILTLIIFAGCTKQNDNSSYILNKNNSSKIFDSASAFLENKNNELLIQIEFSKNKTLFKKTRKFIKKNNVYYEIIVINHFEIQKHDTLPVLSFALRDTTFNFKLDYEQVKPMTLIGIYNWSYNIKKMQNNQYSLTKINLVDSTLKEEFLFDKNYNIKKISFFNSNDTLVLN